MTFINLFVLKFTSPVADIVFNFKDYKAVIFVLLVVLSVYKVVILFTLVVYYVYKVVTLL